MKTHSIIIMGGLGNQLFQIFTLLNYCIENKSNYIFPKNMQEWEKNKERHTYWNSIFNQLNKKTVDNCKINGFNLYNEKKFAHYQKIPKLPTNTLLKGYFQSNQYFEKNYNKIKNILKISEKQQLIKHKYLNIQNTISLHFRIGDYTKYSLHPIISDNYFIKAIKFIINKTKKNDWNIFYACEKNDDTTVSNRIKNIKKNFKNIKFIKISNKLQDWEQMLLMSSCDHNIIANSSFSWWSAYLNCNKHKIICYPALWLGKNRETPDLIPKQWNKI